MHESDELAFGVAELVRGVEAGRRLRDDANRDRERDQRAGLACGAKKLAHAHSLDPLHREEQHPVVLAEIEDLRDVGVANLGREARLVQKESLVYGIGAEARQDRFEGDHLLEAAAASQSRGPYRGHPARAHAHEQLVATEDRSHSRAVRAALQAAAVHGI